MCGIAGIVNTNSGPVERLPEALEAMGTLISHRGPDGFGQWQRQDRSVGLVHRRLAIIDLSEAAAQPMHGENGAVISFNGEIYNYRELRESLAGSWAFRSHSDTECILAAYVRHGDACVGHLRGMFAFAIWDESRQRLFCARDRFGIKPFYYAQVDGVFYFASEAKALLPFLPSIDTNPSALAEYLTFQYTLGEKTLFDGVHQLLPGQALSIENGKVRIWRYWDVRFQIDWDHSPAYFRRRLRELVEESLSLHLRSDVSVGSYVSGGIDSSLIHLLANRDGTSDSPGFHGRFTEFPGYDESRYAQAAADCAGGKLHIADIRAQDFRTHIRDVIYHLDFPVAGPGSFPQYMVSKLAASHLKVVLGGQGGDEIFGGYARYVVAYFEQCMKAAIEGNYKNNQNYVVTIESIVPNLGLLREYKPLMKEFWRSGLFDPMDQRYFRLVDRSTDMEDEIDWTALDRKQVFEDFAAIFNNPANPKNLIEKVNDTLYRHAPKEAAPPAKGSLSPLPAARRANSRSPFAATAPTPTEPSASELAYVPRHFLGQSEPFRELTHRLWRVRDFRAVLLLQGEAGSPFEPLARDLKEISIFHDGPFMECPAAEFATPRLLEALAPTLLAQDAGTLLVTGVETFTPEQQKILQALLASRDMFQPFARRFRVVLAATPNLADLADSGQFNETLFYKISTLTIAVPAMRELRPDILANVRQLLDGKAAAGQTAKPYSLTTAAANWLESQPWPGNYRQIGDVVLGAAGDFGGEIDVPALEAALRAEESRLTPPAPVAPIVPRQTRTPFVAPPPPPSPPVSPVVSATVIEAAPIAPRPAPAPAVGRAAPALTARGLFRPEAKGYSFAQRLRDSLATADALARG